MSRGGYRPGAGRPKGSKVKNSESKKPRQSEIPQDIRAEAALRGMTPLDYMLKVMRDRKATKERRDRMAIAAAPFCHARKGEGQGKKDEKADKAKAAGAGKFAPGPTPIRVVK